MKAQCYYQIERRGKGKRYVYSRRRCRNKTTRACGLCHVHCWHLEHRVNVTKETEQ